MSLTARQVLEGLAVAEHVGDVNEYLPSLTRLLGEDPPVWNEKLNRYIWPWEEIEDEEDD